MVFTAIQEPQSQKMASSAEQIFILVKTRGKRRDDQDVRKNKTSLLTFRSLMVKKALLKAGKSNGDPLRSDSFPGSLGLPR